MFPVRNSSSGSRWMPLGAALLMLTLTGCPEEQVTTGAVQEPVPIKPPPAAAPNPNFIQIDIGETVKTDGCQAQLLTFRGERPSVLMIKSYLDAHQEMLPSAMLQAHVAAREASSLIGTTVQAEVYLMTPAAAAGASSSGKTGIADSLAGVTWHTPPGEPAQIKITSVDDRRIAGEIVSGELVNTLTRKRHPLKGRFTGPLQ